MEREGDIYFKESTHTIVGAGKSESSWAAQQAGNKQKFGVTISRQNFFSWNLWCLLLLRLFNGFHKAHPYYHKEVLLTDGGC